MRVRREGLETFPGSRVPDFDCFVLGGGVDSMNASPANAGYGGFVTC